MTTPPSLEGLDTVLTVVQARATLGLALHGTTLHLAVLDAQVRLKEAKAELFNLRFQMATSQLDNTARVKQVKKDIARIMTEMRAHRNPCGSRRAWR